MALQGESMVDAGPILVPHNILNEETLRSLIDSFILREGTDYGLHEASHTSKVDQIKRQLESGDVQIIYDPASESVNILTKQEASQALKAIKK